ncbi:hypothetical protein G6M89_03565 [Natronolimnobius sp. AArcel1]|uniref:hypothetical protein n=1 Tax=Natronolimnobius sp. AArcel1 TaxID=1679093 RepID=UPI0013EE3BFE|nr:hypothetical protein [Natronolimnobius sp. AArcel1]NGM68098.1 hypothetical protein [Natronolimnobius sp. AArcel1]
MSTPVTIHCNCGTDVRTATTDNLVTCPDCETAFAARIIPLETTTDTPDHGVRSYRGP